MAFREVADGTILAVFGCGEGLGDLDCLVDMSCATFMSEHQSRVFASVRWNSSHASTGALRLSGGVGALPSSSSWVMASCGCS